MPFVVKARLKLACMRLHVQKQEYQSGLRWICSMQNKMLLRGPSGRAVKFTTGILNSRESTGDWQNTKASRWNGSVLVKWHMEYKWRLYSEPWYHQLQLCSVILFIFDFFLGGGIKILSHIFIHNSCHESHEDMMQTHIYCRHTSTRTCSIRVLQSVSSQQSQSSPLKYTGRHCFVCVCYVF